MNSSPAPTPPRPPLPDTPPPSAGDVRGQLAEVAAARDRQAGRMVRLLTSTRDPATIFDGLSPRVWLQQVARMTAREARTVLATAETLRRLPTVATALADGHLLVADRRDHQGGAPAARGPAL